MKIISKTWINRVPAGAVGEVLRFDEGLSGVLHFTCIFYGYTGTYIVEHWDVESFDS